MKAHLSIANHSSIISYWVVLLLFGQSIRQQQFCHAKIVSGRAKLSGLKPEHTMMKFAASAGGVPALEATFATSEMYTDERFLKLYVYVDNNWDKVKKATTCSAKVKLAEMQSPLSFNLVSKTDQQKHGQNKKQKDGKEYTWEADKIELEFDQTNSTRPRYWYITIADCSLEEYYHDGNDIPSISYKLTVWDDPLVGAYIHLPCDEKGMGKLHFGNIVLSLALALFILVRTRSIGLSRGEVHFASLVVFLACGISALSSLFELVHLNFYERNGIGFYLFDALGAHFEALCDACVALLLLAVAVGWTLPSDINIRFGESNAGGTLVRAVEGLRNPSAAVAGQNSAGILALGLVAVHSVLAQWGRTYDDDFDCYHDLEHPPGKALFLLRLLLGFVFLLGVAGLRRSTHCSQSLNSFLRKFSIVGISWFMALPAIATLTSSIIPEYRRHQVVTSWASLVQLTSLASLAWLFTAGSSASAFHKVSKVGGSGEVLDAGSCFGSTGAGGLSFKFGKTKVRLD